MSAENLTEKQAAFVRFAAEGVPQGKAAELAGYSSPDTDGCRLARLPHVIDAIREHRSRVIVVEIGALALAKLRKLLTDDSVPAGVAFSATKLGLALAGHGEIVNKDSHLEPKKPLSEMTQAELAAYIADARAVVQAADRLVVDAESVEVTDSAPNSAPLALKAPA